jgi:DNA-binding GntR family transcriptional regulator
MGSPDYQRVAADIAAKIQSGILKPGDRLPPIKAMAADYGVGQTTIKNALVLLGERGLTRGQQGRATFVATPPT